MILNDLNEEKNSFHRLAGNLPGIVYRVLIEEDNRMIFFNDMVQTMTGYNPEDLKKGKVYSIDPLILPEDKLNVINTIKDAIENNVSFEVEYRINSKNGAVKWFFERGKPVNVDNGKPSYIEGIIFDVTKQKEVEKKLRKSEEQYKILSTELEAILDHYPGLAFYKDTNNNFIRINQKIVDYYNSNTAGLKANLTKKDIEGKNLSDLLPKDIAQAYWDDDLEVIKSGTPKLNIQESFKTEHGIKWLNSNKIPYYDENSEIRGIIGFSIDITDSKKAEQILIESEKKFKLMYENAPLGYLSLDSNGNILEVNKAWINFFGYSKDEVIGKWFGDFIDSEYLEVFNANFHKFNETGEICEEELGIIKKNGSHAIILFDGNISYDENGNFKQTHCIFQDITERKKTEEKLKESEQKYKDLANLLPQVICETDVQGNLTFINQNAYKVFGYTQEDFNKGLNALQMISPKDRERTWRNIKRILNREDIDDVEYMAIRKDGSLFPVIAYASPIIQVNKSVGLRIIIIDASNLKKIEEELRKSEEKYRNLVENAQEGVWAVDENKDTIFVNPKICEMLGYTKDEMMGKNLDLFLDDSMLELINSFRKHREKGLKDTYDLELIKKDGIPIYTSVKAAPILNENGEFKGSFAYITDITNRKKAEQKLKESEERFRDLANSLPQIISETDERGKLTFVNNNAFKVFGYTLDDFNKGLNALQMLIPEDRKWAMENITKRLSGNTEEKLGDNEYTALRKDGSTFPVIIYSSTIIHKDRSVGIRSVIIDITDKLKAKQKLESEKEKAQKYLDIAGVIIIAINADQTVQLINQKGCEILEEEESKIIGTNWFDNYIPENVRGKMKKSFNQIMSRETEPIEYYENSVISKNGKKRIISWYNRILKNKAGQIIGTLSSGRDITARKQSEEKLRKQNVFLNNILESLTHPFYVINADDYSVALTNFTASYEGLELGQYCYNLTHDSDKPCEAPCKCPLEEVKRTKRACIVEHKHYDKGGKVKIYEISGYPILDEGGNVVQMIEYAINITDRKKAENNLQKIAQQWRTTFDAMSESVFLLDIEQNILQCNKATLDILGKEKYDEIIGHSCCEIMHGIKEPVEWCPMTRMIESSHKEYSIAQLGDKWCEISSNPVINEEGTLIGAVHIITDITERRKTEQQLRESEEKFRTIAERTFMGIVIFQNEQIRYVNNAFSKMFGYSYEEISIWEKDDLANIIHPDDLSSFREYHENLRLNDFNQKQYISYRIFTKYGKLKWIDQFSKEILYKGSPAELITIIDITEKKEVEQELIKLSNLKSEILRRTSHELKTPLVSIKGFSDLLLELHKEKLDDYVTTTIKQIRIGCSRLESLISDILKTAELDSGAVQLKKSKEDLSLLIKLCVAELRGLSDLRNHSIKLSGIDPLIASFENEQMHIVISNILSNAIKFTPSRGIIEVKLEKIKDFIIISIKDNGLGFTEEEKTKIFKQFGKIERYGQGYDVLSEGSGLGLYISKKIVELHGGEIWVESKGRNKGSTFKIRLPFRKEIQ